MIKLLIISCFAATNVLARPAPQIHQAIQNWADAILTRYDFNNIGLGGYSYSWEQSDGYKRDETAEILNEGTDNESLSVKGSYSYVGPDGVTYTVNYTADENGFQPEGEHIPPSAGVKKPNLGIPSAALASLAGGGLG